MSRFHQVLAAAIQNEETKETQQEMKMVPRLPKYLLRGALSSSQSDTSRGLEYVSVETMCRVKGTYMEHHSGAPAAKHS